MQMFPKAASPSGPWEWLIFALNIIICLENVLTWAEWRLRGDREPPGKDGCVWLCSGSPSHPAGAAREPARPLGTVSLHRIPVRWLATLLECGERRPVPLEGSRSLRHGFIRHGWNRQEKESHFSPLAKGKDKSVGKRGSQELDSVRFDGHGERAEAAAMQLRNPGLAA